MNGKRQVSTSGWRHRSSSADRPPHRPLQAVGVRQAKGSAALERRHVTAVELTSTLLGQTMPEIQLALASGAGRVRVAKIDRRDGEAVVAALDLGST